VEKRLESLLIAHGATSFLAGMISGLPFAFFLLGRITLWPFPGSIEVQMPGDVRAWRMAHLEGILNGLMLIAVAAVGSRLDLTPRAQRVLTWSLIVTAWGNVVASNIGPLFGGRGLAFGDGVANSSMYLLFLVAVVAVMVAFVLVLRGSLASLRTLRSGALR
jgi:hypothetical protein